MSDELTPSHPHHLPSDLTPAIPQVLDDLNPASHPHHSHHNPSNSLSDIGCPPLLSLPSSYNNRLRQSHAAHTFIGESHNHPDILFSDSVAPPANPTHNHTPVLNNHSTIDDASDSDYGIIEADAQPKAQVPNTPIFSILTGDTLADPHPSYQSRSAYTLHKPEPQPQPQSHSHNHNHPDQVLFIPNAQVGSVTPTSTPSPHARIPPHVGTNLGPNMKKKSSTPSFTSDMSKDVITPLQSPASVHVDKHDAPGAGRIQKKPRKPRKMKICRPNDMNLDVVRRSAEAGRDAMIRELDGQLGGPDAAEAEQMFKSIFERARSMTEKEKIEQRERKRHKQPTAKGASRLEAALSRYTKEVFIQTLLVELEVLTKDYCTLKKAYSRAVGCTCASSFAKDGEGNSNS